MVAHAAAGDEPAAVAKVLLCAEEECVAGVMVEGAEDGVVAMV